jgi:hypothetical protein
MADGHKQLAANKPTDEIQNRFLRKKENPFPDTNNPFMLSVLRQQH